MRALFFGLGADGTVGANKNSVKIIAEDPAMYAQGYFVYDSHKSGAQTVSHLRFGPRPIRAPYLIESANFVACHQASFLGRIDVLRLAAPGGTFLLNSPMVPTTVWDHLPRSMQAADPRQAPALLRHRCSKVAREAGLGERINTVLQTCFFAISGVLPREAGDRTHQAFHRARATATRAPRWCAANFAAVDRALAHLYEVRSRPRRRAR